MASDIGIRGGCAFPILAGPEVAAVLEFYTDVPRKADKPLLAVLGQIGIQLGRLVERRRSEDALRALPGRILEAQEAERRRVAHDLHDDVCQRLSATKLHIGAFESEVPKGERKLHAKLRLIKRQINLNIQEVRRIAAHLRPTTLDDMGLPVALRLLCEDFEKVNRTRAVFRMKNITPERLGSPAELTLYRIAQEGLSNVAKHAQARTVEIDLQRVNGIIRLNIADNGRGFEADRPHAESLRGYKLGLLNMKERAELLNGTCRIESAPGKGTTVVVEIPFDPEVSHAKD
jgi:signal transduction histidine kinase